VWESAFSQTKFRGGGGGGLASERASERASVVARSLNNRRRRRRRRIGTGEKARIYRTVKRCRVRRVIYAAGVSRRVLCN